MSLWLGWRNVAGGVIDGTVTEVVAVALGWDRPTASDSWPCQHSLHRGPQMCFFVTGVTEVNRSGVTGFTVTDVQSATRNLSPGLALHISLQMSRHSTDPSSDQNQEPFLIWDWDGFLKDRMKLPDCAVFFVFFLSPALIILICTWSLGWKMGLLWSLESLLSTVLKWHSHLYLLLTFCNRDPIFLTFWY